MDIALRFDYGEDKLADLPLEELIAFVLASRKLPQTTSVSVTFVSNERIHELNRDYRGIDKPTDVLSVPMFSFVPGELPDDLQEELDPATGLLPLGDMAISLERARAQAQEYGHSAKREIGYLTVHSILHLLGYDHMDEGEQKRQMRAREEQILADIVLPR